MLGAVRVDAMLQHPPAVQCTLYTVHGVQYCHGASPLYLMLWWSQLIGSQLG